MNEAIEEIIPDAEEPTEADETVSFQSEDSEEPTSNEDSEITSAPEAADEVDYASLEAEDVRAIRALFPECRDIESVTELDNPLRYAALRDLGLTVREAFLATQKRVARYDNRSHLKGAVPRGAKSDGVSMSSEELRAARELFSGLSDSEIQKLYKNVIK